jgi:hypothetical protein
MLNIDVRLDVSSLALALDDIDNRQVRFATALALSWTARDAQAEIKREIRRVFDRPTPFTLNSTFVRYATRTKLQAEIGIKDFASKSKPPILWLSPEIYGGGRPFKQLEFLLIRAGLLRSGEFVVPGEGAKLDSYGNMSRGQIQQILAATQTAFDVQQRSTAASKRRHRIVQRIFALRERRGKLLPGVYIRNGRGVSPLLLFVRAPHYMVRLAFDRIVQRVVSERFVRQYELASRYVAQSAAVALPIADAA